MKMTKEETCSLGSSFVWFSNGGNISTNVLSSASRSSDYFLGELLGFLGTLISDFWGMLIFPDGLLSGFPSDRNDLA